MSLARRDRKNINAIKSIALRLSINSHKNFKGPIYQPLNNANFQKKKHLVSLSRLSLGLARHSTNHAFLMSNQNGF